MTVVLNIYLLFPLPSRSLAYSTLADLVHHIRTHLPLSHLSLAVHLFSKNVHDDSLPVSIQTISCKLLLNLVECIRLKAEQEPAMRVNWPVAIKATSLHPSPSLLFSFSFRFFSFTSLLFSPLLPPLLLLSSTFNPSLYLLFFKKYTWLCSAGTYMCVHVMCIFPKLLNTDSCTYPGSWHLDANDGSVYSQVSVHSRIPDPGNIQQMVSLSVWLRAKSKRVQSSSVDSSREILSTRSFYCV